jgi:hypothetical protein
MLLESLNPFMLREAIEKKLKKILNSSSSTLSLVNDPSR